MNEWRRFQNLLGFSQYIVKLLRNFMITVTIYKPLSVISQISYMGITCDKLLLPDKLPR